MDPKHSKSANGQIKGKRVNTKLGVDLVVAIKVIEETSGINSQDYIDKTRGNLGTIIQTDSKDKYEYMTFSDLKTSANLTKPIKFFGRINHISDTYPLSFDGSSVNYDAINVEIIVSYGQIINAIPVVGDRMKKKITDLYHDYSTLCFYGTILYGLKVRDKSKASDKDNLEYKFFITDVEQADDSYEARSYEERENARRLMSDKDLQDELMVALNILEITEKFHQEGYYKSIWERLGATFIKIPREGYDLKESLMNVLKKDNVLKPVKFYGTINSFSNPKILSIKRATGFIVSFDAVVLELKDLKNNTVKTIPIVTDKKKNKILELKEQYSKFCFYGLVSYGLKKRKSGKPVLSDLDFMFIILDIEPAENMIEMLSTDKSEIAKSRNLVQSINKNQNDILKYIKKQVVLNLNLKGLDISPQLDIAVDFLILQSFSGGRIDKESARLHSLVIGTPAVGKGKLAQLIHSINQIVREAQGSRLSVAGIAGGGKGDSAPGMIPTAHNGIFLIQDFHSADKKKIILDVLSHVMQEGEIIIAMESQTKHQALTSVHIDMNKISDIYFDDPTKIKAGRYKKLQEIGIPMNILTRFDFIVDIPRDAARQHEAAKDKLRSPVEVGGSLSGGDQSDWAIELKKIIAILQTDYKLITIEEDVAAYMTDKFDALFTDLGSLEMISDFSMRLANSLQKMTAAVCRANARSVAVKADADYAIKFMKQKVEFLKHVQPEGLQVIDKTDKNKGPVELLKEKFAGKEFTLNEASDFLHNEVGKTVGDGQIRNFLKSFNKIKDGRQGSPAKWKA